MISLSEFIESVEASAFRTGHDTGANPCALSVWNRVREYAGLPELTQHDLMMRHAEDKGWTEQEALDDYAKMEQYSEWQSLKQAEQTIKRLRENGEFPDQFDWDADPKPYHYKIRSNRPGPVDSLFDRSTELTLDILNEDTTNKTNADWEIR